MNMRGKKNPHPKKMPFDEEVKILKDCFDCEGCLCEDFCKELEEKHFGKEGDINE